MSTVLRSASVYNFIQALSMCPVVIVSLAVER